MKDSYSLFMDGLNEPLAREMFLAPGRNIIIIIIIKKEKKKGDDKNS